jgi:hypothetical protein
MEPLLIKPTEFTPKIWFEPQYHIFEMEGFSRPENVSQFYNQVLDYLDDFENEIVDQKKFNRETPLKINFKFAYFNSASSKFIIDIIGILLRFNKKGFPIEFYWYYDEEDEVILEAGEDISEIVAIPFKYIEVKN